MSISRLFEISRSALFTYQNALAVASHNIANANNPFYTRQRALLTAYPPDIRARLAFGTGVQIADVQRIRQVITDRQTWGYNQSHASAQKHSNILASVESILGEPSDLGLSNAIGKFFNSWTELSADPTSVPRRNNVIQTAQTLAGKIQNIYEGTNTLKVDIKNDSEQIVSNVNRLLGEIKTVNNQLYETTVGGYNNNDLLDQRDQLINELSQLVNINVNIDQFNGANISIGGVYAADRAYAAEFKVSMDNGKMQLQTEDGGATVSLQGGELFANFRTYNTLIPKYQEEIDKVAITLMDKVNELHETGYTITDPPQTGIKFFESYSNGVLKINEDILNDINFIAISSTGEAGDNGIAIQIAGLEHEKLIDGFTISESYFNMVGSLGNEKLSQDQNEESFRLVLESLEQQHLEQSGVSTDEEMINVLKYQRSYDAAAKLIKIADDLLGTIMDMV